MPPHRSWTDTQLKKAVRKSKSFRELHGQLGLKSNNYKAILHRIKELKLDYSHFKTRVSHNKTKRPLKELLKKERSRQAIAHIKYRLFDEEVWKDACHHCGDTSWLGEPMPTHIHHIDGDRTNNQFKNLMLVCPNCHAYLHTYML